MRCAHIGTGNDNSVTARQYVDFGWLTSDPGICGDSADLIKRNLQDRVQALLPVGDPAVQAELREFLDLQLSDTCGAWLLPSDGPYIYIRRMPEITAVRLQQAMLDKTVAQA